MISVLKDPQERTRFLRFAVVGTFGAVVDFGVANLLVHLFHAQLVVAGTISFICAIISNFTWNRYWTYPDSRTKTITRQLVEFTVVSVAGLVIRVPILKFVEPVLSNLLTRMPYHLPLFTPDVLADNVTLAIAVVIVMFWNFFVNRYWTYSDVSIGVKRQ
jgi:putative flippase GtrA